MAGQGDIDNPNAFTSGSPTLGTGSIAAVPAQGDVTTDGGNPDFFIGSFTLQVVAPTLGVAALPAVPEQGDVGDVYGVDDAQGSTLSAWASEAPSLTTQSTTAPHGQGDVNDPDAFSAVAPTLTTQSTTTPPEHGDVGEMYGLGEGPIGQVVWQIGGPALGVGSYSTPTGEGDIPDPYAWQDVVIYYTSQLYPLARQEQFGVGFTMPPPGFLVIAHYSEMEPFGIGLTMPSGVMNVVASYGFYTNWPIEKFGTALTMPSGQLLLVTGYVNYTNWTIEKFGLTLTMPSGSLTVVAGYINYTNWPAEKFGTALTMTGGTLA